MNHAIPEIKMISIIGQLKFLKGKRPVFVSLSFKRKRGNKTDTNKYTSWQVGERAKNEGKKPVKGQKVMRDTVFRIELLVKVTDITEAQLGKLAEEQLQRPTAHLLCTGKRMRSKWLDGAE